MTFVLCGKGMGRAGRGGEGYKKNLKSQSLFAFSTVTVMRPESSDLDLNLTSQQSLGEKLGMNQVLFRIFCDFIQISIFFSFH